MPHLLPSTEAEPAPVECYVADREPDDPTDARSTSVTTSPAKSVDDLDVNADAASTTGGAAASLEDESIRPQEQSPTTAETLVTSPLLNEAGAAESVAHPLREEISAGHRAHSDASSSNESSSDDESTEPDSDVDTLSEPSEDTSSIDAPDDDNASDDDDDSDRIVTGDGLSEAFDMANSAAAGLQGAPDESTEGNESEQVVAATPAPASPEKTESLLEGPLLIIDGRSNPTHCEGFEDAVQAEAPSPPPCLSDSSASSRPVFGIRLLGRCRPSILRRS